MPVGVADKARLVAPIVGCVGGAFTVISGIYGFLRFMGWLPKKDGAPGGGLDGDKDHRGVSGTAGAPAANTSVPQISSGYVQVATR